MKAAWISIIILCSAQSFAMAEEYTCTYKGFLNDEPVIQKVKISKDKASVGDNGYTVLQNTDVGVVLARSFAFNNKGTKATDIGAFVFTIDKATLKMTRGNVLSDGSDGAIRVGKCVK